ncbi:hypothetical protein OE88DRAFT_1738119 [Heliocybe sulcata]|uniref:DUF7223 domain-containing protein n=1 Tax=Heliocybe sulcata TaxID=5364 RepID=A0A5C3MW54_9AGAM|nr:hypothetical protein OE88DRAFT_1738119 [Heliocybe sulcata]
MIHSFLTLAPFLVASAAAANDWSKPCTDGSCYYDVNANGTAGQASGTLKIWGSSNMLSDITTAAGWQILNCDQNTTQQDIRLVCMNETASCNHLFQDGAENTLVRLPENCGASPFARVAKAWVSTDQSMPDLVKANLTRRDGTVPQVQALTLDTSWSSIDSSSVYSPAVLSPPSGLQIYRKGNISFAIMGASFPGVTGTIDTSNLPPQRRSRLTQRGLLDGIVGALTGSFNHTTEKTSPVTVNKDLDFPPISVSCNGFSASLKTDIDTNINANVTYGMTLAGTIVPPHVSEFVLFSNFDADIAGTLNVQATAAGTLDSGKIPLFQIGLPGLDIPGIFTLGPSFAVNGELTAQAAVDLDMTVDLAYNVKNGQLFFPSPPSGQKNGGAATPQDTNLKLSVTPDVQANVSLTAHLIPELDFGINVLSGLASATVFLDLDAYATLGMQLNAQGNVITVSGSGNSTQTNTTASMTSTATTSNSNPTVKVTLGKSQTASTTAKSIQSGSSSQKITSASSSKETRSTSLSEKSSATSKSEGVTSVAETATSASAGIETATSHAPADTTAIKSPTAKATVEPTEASGSSSSSKKSSGKLVARGNTTASGSIDGCVTVDTGLKVNAGASGSFFDFFSASTQVTLFQVDFQLFKKCFGTATPSQKRALPAGSPFGRRVDGSRRSPGLSPIRRESSLLNKRISIVCPAFPPTSPLNIVNDVIQAASLHAI